MKYSIYPQRIDKFNWFYEKAGHISFVHEVRDEKSEMYIRTDHIKIPWHKITKSVDRYKKIKALKSDNPVTPPTIK